MKLIYEKYNYMYDDIVNSNMIITQSVVLCILYGDCAANE